MARLVHLQNDDGVGLLTLADPTRRNALSRQLSDDLAAAVRDALDGGARALVLAAEPPVFCAGGSLDDDRAVATVTQFILRWLDERDLLVARLELTLQAVRDPALAASLGAHRRVLVDVVGGLLTARGKPHGAAAAETLVASFDGVLIGALPRPAAQRKAFVRRSDEALMAVLG